MKCLHNILKGISLTGALFVFQACYGIARPPLYEDCGEAPMTFTLVSHATGAPLEGIRILGGAYQNQKHDLGTTGADGKCRVEIPYFRNESGPFLSFQDPEGKYMVKDTTLADLRERDILVKLDLYQ